jgi:hypothetical protein
MLCEPTDESGEVIEPPEQPASNAMVAVATSARDDLEMGM